MLINAIGTYSASQPLESMAITRRDPGPQDVQIAIAYCGVCHSDLHQARSEWAGTLYPCVPGHEIVGRVTAVGNAVSRYAVGDLVGVGCMVDSCQQCEECAEGLENYCDHMVLTYNGPTQDAPGHTLGGYSQQIVVNERYVLRITHPEAQLAAVAPLLKRDGTMTLVGAPATPHPSPEVFNLIFRRRSIAGSMIGGIPETQEMLDFCAEHGIVADIELIRGDEINEAWERMVKGDVKYRFVIDSATLAG
ncbi:TPA: NAD(P)-dependent alcohol dehydrogenase [Klebsiella pneumoniae subsp. pneumoniae]|nr:NAD(P)-dependent alcohol dehydrogenase [Klebsiella pneumoniae subsp. pneumoniae]